MGVIGLGYVGLPLAVAFGKAGFRVEGIDKDQRRVSELNRGHSYIGGVESSELTALQSKGFFKATHRYERVKQLDVVIICVPTPLNKTGEPDISYIVDAVKGVASYLKRGQLIVLESTTYPGTTEEVVLPRLLKSGLKVESDFFLTFSPERVDPGNERFGIRDIPKVLGGVGPHSTRLARQLYESILSRVVVVSSPKTAEMAKLLENTFRSVNIALVNEMALLCEKMGVDIWEVIEAAKTKPFGFLPFYPGPGIGGHCINIDPVYLSWKARKDHDYEAKLVEIATEINNLMPHYVVERITRILNKHNKPLRRSRILLVGVAYKKNVSDTRESPALEIMERLIKEGAKITYHDPYVETVMVKRELLKSHPLNPHLLDSQDLIVILTDHSQIDYRQLVHSKKPIFDTRNALSGFTQRENIIRL